MTDEYHPAIRARGVSKRFGEVVALVDFNLDVHTGHLLTVLGPSGSGKTTALRVIAGFDKPDTGHVEIDGQTVAGSETFMPPERRRLGMVFQDYALFPHLSVARNIAYGVTDRNQRTRRVSEMLDLVGLTALGDRMPADLSGGEQQRVALARALAPNPRVILLDEPFSNLDAALRARVRSEFRTVLEQVGATAVFVTHDQEEALAMSDLVAVMRAGVVVQAAPPEELYSHPVDAWVGGFLGEADFLVGSATNGYVVSTVGRFPSSHTGHVTVMVRPEAVVVTPSPSGQSRVVDTEFFGHDQLITVRLPDDSIIRSRSGTYLAVANDDPVDVAVTAVTTFED